MNPWTEALVAALATVGTVLTAWMTQRSISRRAKSDAAQAMIDQLQEERDAAEERHADAIASLDHRRAEELGGVRRELADLRHRMDGMEDRELAFSDYVAALRDHIEQRLGPPPPPWPAALMRRRPDHPTSQ